MTMDYQNILIASENAIATITINRPTKLNALNKETIQELHQAIETLEKETTVRVIIITGSGEKAFVAGADIAEFADFSIAEGLN
jgi:enoyl-CoA hydratase